MSKGPSRIAEFIKKALFIDFVKGLSITLKYNVSRSITLKYPDEEKWVPDRRFRGQHTLNKDENGRELCVACELCAKVCPTKCITVIPMEDDTGRGIADRVAKVWKVELARCMFCGYCEDACPTRAVRLGRDYELACLDLSCTTREKDELLKPQSIPETIQGGFVVRSKFERTPEGIRVVPDLRMQKKRNI
ncbi:MAG: NADH-quinone oxidoreductase subunit I [Thermodesulfobacteriota bacterium]|nr:MAG: NADH-quinone oxidoreductase subunit I [Thermodesulfobacteriota bacterium]